MVPRDRTEGADRPGHRVGGRAAREFPAERSSILRRRTRRGQLPGAVRRHGRPHAPRPREALPRHPGPPRFRRAQQAQPVAQARARAVRRRGSRRELRHADGLDARRRHPERHPRLRRSGAAHVERRHHGQDVRHRRRRNHGKRGLRRAVLAAEHLRLLRDVRRALLHHAQPPAVPVDG